MKRVLSLILVLMLMIPAALAENGNSAAESLGDMFTKAVEDLSKEADKVLDKAASLAEGTWEDAAKWVEGNWGDASTWVEKTWNNSSSWLSGIWGDLSSLASLTADSANAWWTETFKKVTESSENAWNWFTDAAYGADTAFYEEYNKLKESVSTIGSATLDSVKQGYISLLKKMNLSDEDAEKVWKTITTYADQKGIDQLTVARLALPYLFKLSVDASLSDKPIPAVSAAQFLTAALDKLNLDSVAAADKLLKQFNELLATF